MIHDVFLISFSDMKKTTISPILLTAFTTFASIVNSAAEPYMTRHYEAEAASTIYLGSIETEFFPYVGGGYVELSAEGSYVEWDTIGVPADGEYTLIVKYSNASGAERPCEILVNGETMGALRFHSQFDDWHYYWNARLPVTLKEGQNSIRLQALSADGGPNIDNIAVSRGNLGTPPGKQIDVRTLGAKGDGSANDTAAIQASIDACPSGGSVVLENGIFMSGHLRLKSDMTFWIDRTATLRAIQHEALFPVTRPPTPNVSANDELGKAFLYSEGADNLTITGGGVLDGNGEWENWGSKVDESLRPVPVYLTQGKNITISHLDIIRGAMWNVVPLECDDVFIDGLNIYSTWGMNKDGIDPCDSHRVLVTNCTLTIEDDALCPKSGHPRGVEDVIFRNITVNQTICGMIKLGTKGYGHFKNIVFEDLALFGTIRRKESNVGINLSSVDGAEIENIIVRRVNMRNAATAVFIMHGAGAASRRALERRGAAFSRTPAGYPEKFGDHVRNILIEDIDARECHDPFGNFITGTREAGVTYKVSDVTIRNTRIEAKGGVENVPANPGEYAGEYPNYDWPRGQLPAWGFFVRHAENIVFENLTLIVSPGDARERMVFENTRNITVDSVEVP
jgi:hypothetical protein